MDTPDNPVMCYCSGTRREYIQSLYNQGMDIQSISRWTGALSGCGGCEWDICDFLKELAKQQPSTSPQFDIKDLVKGINEDNLHPEVDFGPPVGKEL